MKLTKVAFAIASVLAVAAGSAHAGQIDSSSATLAIEVIKNNDQTVRSPSKSYGFAGSIDARTNEQRLQLQYTLSKGTWAAAGNVITATNTLIDVSAVPLLTVSYTDAANAPQTALPAGTAVNAFVTADRKTLVFNVTIPATATDVNFLRTPVFSVNTQGALATNNVGINGLFDVAGATACVAPDSNLDINFKHFTNHTGNTTVQLVASPDSEHLRSGSTNDARLLNFTQNLDFQFAPATTASRTDAAFLNQRLSGQNWSAPIVAPVAAAVAPVTRHYIGKVNLRQRGNGLDLDYVHTYGDSVAPFVAASPFIAADFDVADDVGNLSAGQVELNAFTIKLAAAAAALANGAFLFADFPGNALIPQTPSVTTVATLAKDAAAGTPDLREQDNTCTGTLTGIGGGIKIDVRNYASFATFGTTGPATTVRLINNSETQAADVYGQMIYADGTYGAWGKLADLKPPKGGAAVVGNSKAGISDRLRIVSNTGTTLRVQSYMVVGGSVIDTSNAQGVDFENETNNRTPSTAIDAQPVSQDAINGLAR
eukprot:gene3906-3820_t